MRTIDGLQFAIAGLVVKGSSWGGRFLLLRNGETVPLRLETIITIVG